MEGLNKTLSKIPVMLITIIYCGWLGFEYNTWLTAADSELGLRKAQITSTKQELEKTKIKLSEGEQFYRNLDALRDRIRNLTVQLDSTKTMLSAEMDIANFVRMVTLEAKKLGLSIKGIRPENEAKKEYYIEVPFTVSLRGAYVQILVFFDRIAKFQQIIRVSDFNMKPTGNVFTKYVELEGNVKLVAYKYLGTHADEVVNKAEMKGNELGADDKKKGGGK